MPLFVTANQLIVDAENRLLGAKDIPWPFSWLRKEFWHPIVYVMLGMDFLINNFFKTVFYVGLFAALAAYFSTRAGMPSEQMNFAIGVAIMGAVFVVFFALPSTFTNFGIKDADLEFLTQRVQDQVASNEELKGLRDNLEAMEECAASRVAALRWAMATIWGVVLFGFAQSLGLLTKLIEKDQFADLIGGSISFFVVAVFLTIIPLATIAGYRRANNMVFMELRFACNEVALKFSALSPVEEGK